MARHLLAGLLIILVFNSRYLFAENSELSFSWWGTNDRQSATRKAADLFEKNNPGVSIKTISFTWENYLIWLQKQFAAGTEPDIMQVNWAWVSSIFSPNGDGFYDLFNARDQIDPDEFGDMLSTGIVNGKLNGVPVSDASAVFLWQKSNFDKAGAKIPVTWEDLLASQRMFSSKLGTSFMPLYIYESHAYQIINPYILQITGEQWIDPRDNRVRITKETARSLYAFLKKLSSTIVISTGTTLQDGWNSGRISGIHTVSSEIQRMVQNSYDKNNIVFSTHLNVNNSKESGIYGHPSMMFSVSRHSQHPEIAVKFISFLLYDEQAIKILGDTRGIPITKTGYRIFKNISGTNPVSEKVFNEIRRAGYDAVSPYLEHPKIIEHARNIFLGIQSGSMTEEAAIGYLIEGTNEILAQIVHPDFHAPASVVSGFSYSGNIGFVYDIKNKEIIIAGRIGESVKMGDVIIIDTGRSPAYITATFPMMGSARCTIKSGILNDIKPGMKVYRKVVNNN